MVPWGPGMIKIPKPLQQVKTRWHSSYVLVDMGPLLTNYLLTAVPSILTLRHFCRSLSSQQQKTSWWFQPI